MISENEKLRQYLLSSLAEDEMEEVDLRIISDANLEVAFQHAEDELMEDYLENNLTAEETRRFENQFLVTDERRKELEFLSLMKRRASQKAVVIPFRAETVRQPFSARLGKWFMDHKVPVAVAASVILLGLGLLAYWETTRMDPAEKALSDQVAQLNSQDLSTLNDEQKKFSALDLMPGAYRSDDKALTLDSKGSTETVLIRLGLPVDIQTKSLYDVKVYKNGAVMLTIPGKSSYSNPSGQEMRLMFPRETLSKGSYRIELLNGKDPPLPYSFKVE